MINIDGTLKYSMARWRIFVTIVIKIGWGWKCKYFIDNKIRRSKGKWKNAYTIDKKFK